MKYAIRTILAIASIGGGVYAMSSTDGMTDHQCAQRVAELENQVAVYEQAQVIEEQYDKLDAMERVRGDAEASR
nr:MAG TPA: Protein of unknown function (DUF2730) [Caudoviricetes sp.]